MVADGEPGEPAPAAEPEAAETEEMAQAPELTAEGVKTTARPSSRVVANDRAPIAEVAARVRTSGAHSRIGAHSSIRVKTRLGILTATLRRGQQDPLPQKATNNYHYGIREAHKTVLIMVLGSDAIIAVYLDPLGAQ